MIKSGQQSNKATGDALERRVSLYYEALGYQVSRNVLIAGHQIDLVASRYLPGIGDVRIAIEVKSRTSSLGINDVTPFIQTAKHIINESNVTAAALVTNAPISTNAKLAIGDKVGIKLLTLEDLDYHLFNTAESLLRVIKDYEQKRIFSAYYPLDVDIDGAKHPDAVAFLTHWLATSNKLLMLVGDFGSGKSTILERSFYNAALARLSNRDARFPIFLRLRGLRQHPDLWTFIESSLRDYQYITPPRAVFENELQSGRLLILLDGFDEVYSGATAHDRGNYLDFLRPLLKTPSPVVISSRPTFFDSFDELLVAARQLPKEDRIERLPTFGLNPAKMAQAFGAHVSKSLRRGDFAKVMQICQLDDVKIREAIEKREQEIRVSLAMSPQEFERRLYDIYDLEDLMSRPLLLDMILETMATGAIDIKSDKTVGASTLYDVYTQHAAFRDKNRSAPDQFLSPDLRLGACRSMARKMFDKGEILLSPEEVAECVEHTMRGKIKARKYSDALEDIERAVTDIRTCAFLRFADDGSLAFTHKSFYEFFIAQDLYLASRIGVAKFLEYPRHRINKEIMYFLASYVRDQEDFAQFIKLRLHENQSKEDKAFLFSLAFASGELLEKCSLSIGSISGVELSRANIKSARAMMITVESSTVRRVNCVDWIFREVALDACQLMDVNIVKSELELSSNASTMDRCHIESSKLKLSGKNMTINDSDISECSIDVDCTLVLNGCNISDCPKIDFDREAMIFSDRTRIVGSSLSAPMYPKWYAAGSRISLVECHLMGLSFPGRYVFTDIESRAERRIVVSNCTGLIYLEYNEDLEKRGVLGFVQDANPDLFIIDGGVLVGIHEFTKAHRDRIKREQSAKAPVEASQLARKPKKRLPESSRLGAGPPRALTKVHEELLFFLKRSQMAAKNLPLALQDFLVACG